MTDLSKILIPFLIAVSLPATLFAQAELLDEEQPPIKRYTVELVVFAYAENVAVGTEVFPADIIEPIATEDGDIAEIEVTELARRHPDFIDLEPVFLTAAEFAMDSVYERFERLDAYEPIMHVGWTQVGSPQADTTPIPLTAFGTPPDGFEGSFTLVRMIRTSLSQKVRIGSLQRQASRSQPRASITDLFPSCWVMSLPPS